MDLAIFLVYALIVILASIVIGVVVHELGHLIFGLMTGYRFMYIEFCGITIEKHGKRIKLRYHKGLPLGQCIMRPANLETDAKYICLGGVLIQTILGSILLVAGIAFMIIFLSSDMADILDPLAKGMVWAVSLGFIFLFQAFTNYKSNDISADGSTYREIRSAKEQSIIYNQIMEIGYLDYEGLSFAEMGEELFDKRGAKKSGLLAELELYKYYRAAETAESSEELREKLMSLSKAYKGLGVDKDLDYEIYLLRLRCGKAVKEEASAESEARGYIGNTLKGVTAELKKDDLYSGEWRTAEITVRSWKEIKVG